MDIHMSCEANGRVLSSAREAILKLNENGYCFTEMPVGVNVYYKVGEDVARYEYVGEFKMEVVEFFLEFVMQLNAAEERLA